MALQLVQKKRQRLIMKIQERKQLGLIYSYDLQHTPHE